MMAEQRARFERDGYLIIRDALRPDEIATARDALDRVYATAARVGSLGPDGSLHLLSAVATCPEVVGLIDHPATFRYVWSVLGWNIHIYHSHLDVHLGRQRLGQHPPRWFAEPEAGIRKWINEWNKDPKPFVARRSATG